MHIVELSMKVFIATVFLSFFSVHASSSEETNYLLMLPDESKVKQYAQEQDIFDEHHAGFADAFFDMNAHARVINNWLFSIDMFKNDLSVDGVAHKSLAVYSEELGSYVDVHKAVARVLWCPSVKFSTCTDQEMKLLLSFAKQLREN